MKTLQNNNNKKEKFQLILIHKAQRPYIFLCFCTAVFNSGEA